MRGVYPIPDVDLVRRQGIIPAHAGFTSGRVTLSLPGVGSSPHTRGLRAPRGRVHHLGGIIPAHAGFTTQSTRSSPKQRDHPRTRGVYDSSLPAGTFLLGSSPHTRGLHGSSSRPRGVRRIIPAHAGFTEDEAAAGAGVMDHPRTRGVYFSSPWKTLRSRGSSPHTRGLRSRRSSLVFLSGIIPAHAGFTRRVVVVSWTRRDHPRTRGVYLVFQRPTSVQMGSSPHTRGLHVRGGAAGAGAGIIPAHAGFTSSVPFLSVPRPDHPRTRGVYRYRR